jgi:hypothetical protein
MAVEDQRMVVAREKKGQRKKQQEKGRGRRRFPL